MFEQGSDDASGITRDIKAPTTGKMLGLILNDKFNNQYDVLPDVYEEMEKIKDEAIRNGNFMKLPNGEKSNLPEKQRLLVRTKGFKEWFGDRENDKENSSKIVDKNGEPLIVYHGTNNDMDIFDLSKNEANVAWFTTDKKYAEYNAKKNNSNIVKEVFLNIKNPYGDFNETEALDDLHTVMIPFYREISGLNPDGFIGHDTHTEIKISNGYEIAIINPNQIKSIDNYGSFSDSDNNIKH